VNIPVPKVQNWLKQKETYTKYRTARKNFKRNPIIALHIDEQWQGDLAEVGNMAEDNEDVRYLLVLIDVVSRYLFVEPLKTKRGADVLSALKKIFATRKPKKLQTDDGKEFVNREVGQYLKKEGVTFFTVKSDKKAAIAERVIRTLKDKIHRYMNEAHTFKYIDVLQDLVESYNNTYHKGIKMTPAEVTTDTEGEVLQNLYGKAWKEDKKRKKPKFKEGDFVRISRVKGVFEKGYTGQFTEEIFIVDKVKLSAVPQIMYKLKDWNAVPIQGSFYDKELQLVAKGLEDFWKVEKVLPDKRIRRGKVQRLVKWVGFPSSLNSWVNVENIKDIGTERK
jgi:co-chaperonin GroES (HSP10)